MARKNCFAIYGRLTSLLALATISAFTLAGTCQAALLQYNFFSADGSFQFVDSNMPTPTAASADGFRLIETGQFNGSAANLDLDFGISATFAQLTFKNPFTNETFNEAGSQLFSGSPFSPVFSPGFDGLTGASGFAKGGIFTVSSYTAPISVSGVPEPSTWALMLLGLGGLAFLACRKTHRVNTSAAVIRVA